MKSGLERFSPGNKHVIHQTHTHTQLTTFQRERSIKHMYTHRFTGLLTPHTCTASPLTLHAHARLHYSHSTLYTPTRCRYTPFTECTRYFPAYRSSRQCEPFRTGCHWLLWATLLHGQPGRCNRSTLLDHPCWIEREIRRLSRMSIQRCSRESKQELKRFTMLVLEEGRVLCDAAAHTHA